MSTNSASSHRWNYFRAGGFDQVRFQSGADLVNLPNLDQKLWAALCCPTRGVEFDTKTLDLIDTDKDGRVRAPEVLAAVTWTCSMVKNPDHILRGSPSLELDAISDATPEGKQLLASARQILLNLGKKDATTISIEDTTDTTRIFSATHFNGDGIVPADSAPDDLTRGIINDIVACLGSELDRSGKPGVSQPKVETFFAELQAFSDWRKKAESDAAVLPLGDRTAEGLAALNAVRAKIDDYFGRCRLAAFDQRALAAVNRQEADYLTLAARDLSISVSEISTFPLARVEANRPLPLKEGVNPAWAGAIGAFQVSVIKPLLGGEKAVLTESDWSTVLGKFAVHEAWSASKGGGLIEKLGVPRVHEILASKAKDTITGLITKDKALEPEANSIAAVDKLVRFHRDLKQLLVNFVSFEDFYSRQRKAIFQAGTLYLDGRSCDLCVPVADAGKHAALAGLAKSYLAYCDCSRAGGEKLTIAVAFTGGDSDFLMVGRNGLFYDRKGRDWDATITKVIENPISIRQAFWSPYKKLVRLAEEQVAKRAAAAESASDARLAGSATAVANADKAKAEQKKVDVGTVAALGVAVGAIGTAFAAMAGYLGGVVKLPFWQVCLAFIGLLLLISGPAMLIAWLKLRQRNLGPILDANGWAVNGRVKMNVPFGGSLTKVAKLPEGAQPSMAVRYPEAPTALPKFVFTVIIICFIYSLLNHFGLISKLTAGTIGKPAPAASQTGTNTAQTIETNVPPVPAAPAAK